MERINIQLRAALKEVEKTEKAVKRTAAAIAKKRAAAEKVGALWTNEEWYERRDKGEYTNEQFWAFLEYSGAIRDAAEADKRNANAKKRVEQLRELGATEADEYKPARIEKPAPVMPETVPTGNRRYAVSFLEKTNGRGYVHEVEIVAGNAKEARQIAKEQFYKKTGHHAFQIDARWIR